MASHRRLPRFPRIEAASAKPTLERSRREQALVDADRFAGQGWHFGFLGAAVTGGVGVGTVALVAGSSLAVQAGVGALGGIGGLLLLLGVVYLVCRARAPGKQLDDALNELRRERVPDTFLEAEAVYTRRRVQRYLAEPVAIDQPRFEDARRWVCQLWMTFQEIGRHGLLDDIHLEDSMPEDPDDREGQRVYLRRRLTELDQVIERLRRGG